MGKPPNDLINDPVVADNAAKRKTNYGSRYDKPAEPAKELFKQKLPAEKSAKFQSGNMLAAYVVFLPTEPSELPAVYPFAPARALT